MPDAMPAKPIYIYGLVDPRTSFIRYVGKSEHPQKRRVEHLAEARCPRHSKDNLHKANWIRQLLALDLEPFLCILETTTEAEWVERERWWIAFSRDNGWCLTNLSIGGDGVGKISEEGRERIREYNRTREIRPETREKWRQALLGKPMSDYTRQKLLEANLGRKRTTPLTDEQRKRMSDSHKGKPLSEAHKAAVGRASQGEKSSFSKLTDEQVAEVRALYATRIWRQVDLATKFQVSQSCISSIVRGESWKNLPALDRPRAAHCKIEATEVSEIRALYASGNWSQAKLAKKFGVGQTCISSIILRQTWKHVP